MKLSHPRAGAALAASALYLGVTATGCAGTAVPLLAVQTVQPGTGARQAAGLCRPWHGDGTQRAERDHDTRAEAAPSRRPASHQRRARH